MTTRTADFEPAPDGPRKRQADWEVRAVEALRTTVGRQPSLSTARTLLGLLDGMARRTHGTAKQRLREASRSATRYVRESSRESWRRPDPSVWARCVDETEQAANLLEAAVRHKQAALPETKYPAEQDPEVAFGPPHDDYADEAFAWTGCWKGTIRLRPSDAPPAVAVRAVEKALKVVGLVNAYVSHRDGLVELLWPPDKDEQWERDLVADVLERGAAAVNLPSSVVQVKMA